MYFKIIALSAILFSLSGCFGGLSRQEVVAAPNAPLLILEGKGWVKVASHDPETNSMLVIGKVSLQTLKGKTISNFNWKKVQDVK